MASFYIAPEAGIPYKITGEDGTVAVLNDPADPNFVGYLDGEDALSGIDSPEIRDSFAEMSEADGSWAGQSFYTRRPIVMNGRVIPTSAADRNAKLGRLMRACTARFADGTLSWTPSGGEEVFLKFRTQLPFRAKGGFNKDFQVGLVANDPRIYSRAAFHRYTEQDGTASLSTPLYRRSTAAASAAAQFASRNVYLPAGEYDLKIPVRRSTATGTCTLSISPGTSTPATPLTLTTGWQLLTQRVTVTVAENVATSVRLTTNTALSSGQWIEFGDLVAVSPAGLVPSGIGTFATNWAFGTNHTGSFQSASYPTVSGAENQGNARARPRLRVIGPFSSLSIAGGDNWLVLTPSVPYSVSDYAVIDTGYRTVGKNATQTSDYGMIDPTGGWPTVDPGAVTAMHMRNGPSTGATAATRLEVAWRGTWL